jgi:SAM-dependent methyltransferase
MSKVRTIGISLAGACLAMTTLALFVWHGSLSPSIPGERDLDRPAERFERLRPELDALFDRLQLRPGSTVLDIGAGKGHYSFYMAERVGSSGRVFACDVDPEAIRAIRERVNKSGIENVVPVLVSTDGPGGLDEFYLRQKYDFVLASHVYWHIKTKQSYFAALRPNIDREGVLVIIDPQIPNTFEKSTDAISDLQGLVEALQREGSQGVVGRRLRPETWNAMRAWKAGRLPPISLSRLIREDFSGIEEDLQFGKEFLLPDGELRPDLDLEPMERGFAEWLLDYPRREIYPRPELRLGDFLEASRGVRLKLMRVTWLNRLLLIQRFRKHVFEGEVFGEHEPYRRRIVKTLMPDYRLVDYFTHDVEFVAVFRPVPPHSSDAQDFP